MCDWLVRAHTGQNALASGRLMVDTFFGFAHSKVECVDGSGEAHCLQLKSNDYSTSIWSYKSIIQNAPNQCIEQMWCMACFRFFRVSGCMSVSNYSLISSVIAVDY